MLNPFSEKKKSFPPPPPPPPPLIKKKKKKVDLLLAEFAQRLTKGYPYPQLSPYIKQDFL